MNETETTPRGTERIVGAFVVVALLLLMTGFAFYLYRVSERKGWRVPRCPFYTFVNSGEGLNIGDPVVLMGFDVGEISVITAQPPGSYYKVYIGFVVKQPYYGYIWSDSKVKIAASGLLGNRRLEITTGLAGTPTVYEAHNRISELVVDGQRTPFTATSKGIYIEPQEDPALTERAEKLLAQVEAAIPNILTLTNRLNLVLDNSAALTSNANLLVSGLNTNLDATLLSLAAMTSNLNAQVQANDQILTGISTLVVDTDNLVQGLKKHWLLRGAFSKTNAPSAK